MIEAAFMVGTVVILYVWNFIKSLNAVGISEVRSLIEDARLKTAVEIDNKLNKHLEEQFKEFLNTRFSGYGYWDHHGVLTRDPGSLVISEIVGAVVKDAKPSIKKEVEELVKSEAFTDSLVEKLNKKQLKGK